MLNHLYGAACDHQYMLTAMPTLTKRITVSRQKDESRDGLKIDLARFQNFSQLASIYTATSAVVDITIDGAIRKRGRRRRHSKQQSVGSGRSRSRLPVVESIGLDRNDCFHHKQGDGAGICEECGGPLHLPRVPREKKKEVEKAPAREVPSIGAGAQGKPDVNAPPSTLHNWYDPLAPWNRGKPSDGKT